MEPSYPLVIYERTAAGKSSPYKRRRAALLYHEGEVFDSSEIRDGSNCTPVVEADRASLASLACLGAGSRLRMESILLNAELSKYMQSLRTFKRR
jgi:hypothetical protein